MERDDPYIRLTLLLLKTVQRILPYTKSTLVWPDAEYVDARYTSKQIMDEPLYPLTPYTFTKAVNYIIDTEKEDLFKIGTTSQLTWDLVKSNDVETRRRLLNHIDPSSNLQLKQSTQSPSALSLGQQTSKKNGKRRAGKSKRNAAQPFAR